MEEAIHLSLGVANPPSPYDALDILKRSSELIPDAVKRTIHSRDSHSCRFCGFSSTKYQEIVTLTGDSRDVDGAVTACIFCYQVLNIDRVPAMRSGILIWLPEVPQTQLHHVARELYMWRITKGSQASRAHRVLDRLVERRAIAEQQLGSDDLFDLAQRLRRRRQGLADPDLDAALSGLRLFPLDRRIVRENDLEFNQFPQILAFLRSSHGPFAMGTRYPGIAHVERFLLSAEELGEIGMDQSS